jgi:glutathione S-transferase
VQLIIGNKNYSSWSMRPWILLRHFGIAFEEIRIPLFVPGYQDELRKYSPTLRVPVLQDGGLTLWDSLAICEYVSEKYLQGAGMPAELMNRARCRSYCCEMHAGFTAIRTALPMNCRAQRRLDLSAEVLAEVERVDELWKQALEEAAGQGDFLFGDFSIADCMYAPVAMRFHSYGVSLSARSQQYLETLLNNSAIKQWREEAAAELEQLSDYEVGISTAS